eukprot:1270665-Pyramimonas_sp.AAC.1
MGGQRRSKKPAQTYDKSTFNVSCPSSICPRAVGERVDRGDRAAGVAELGHLLQEVARVRRGAPADLG